MGAISQGQTRRAAAQAAINSPNFRMLSPQTQQLLYRLLSDDSVQGNGIPSGTTNQQFVAALGDAKAHGIDINAFDPTGLYVVGGLTGAGLIAGAAGAGGAGAASSAGGTSAGVGVGETAATQGITPAVAGGIGEGSAVGSGIGGAATAAGGGMSIWDTIGKLAPIIQAGTGIAGSAIAANANTEAAKIQAAEADKALALQKQIYDTTRGDLGPYRDIGGAAVGQLGYGLGLPGYESGKAPAQPTPPAFGNPLVGGPGASQSQIQPGTRTVTNTPGSTSNATGPGNTINPYFTAGQQAAGGGMVTVKAPNGSVGQIPANRLNDALAAGGQVVS